MITIHGSQFFAHSENPAGRKEPVIEHLNAMAKLAGDFASAWGRREEGEVAALMHDLGKYTPLFQKVLRREEAMVDRKNIFLKRCGGIAAPPCK